MPPRTRAPLNGKTTGELSAAAEKSHALDFRFEHDGKLFYLPPLYSVKAGITRRIRRLEAVDAMFTVIEAVADETTLAAIDDMDMDELSKITVAWQKHSGVTLGE